MKCCVGELWMSYSQSSICYMPHWQSCGFTLSLGPGSSLPKSIERATPTQGNYESQRGSRSADSTVVVLKNCFFPHLSSCVGNEGHGQVPHPEATHVNDIFDWKSSWSSFSVLVWRCPVFLWTDQSHIYIQCYTKTTKTKVARRLLPCSCFRIASFLGELPPPTVDQQSSVKATAGTRTRACASSCMIQTKWVNIAW